MKALSLTQPWASLMAHGEKAVETRSWRVGYRGLVAIHASGKFPVDCRELLLDEPYRAALARHGLVHRLSRFYWDRLPLGAIVATADLVAIYPTEYVLTLTEAFRQTPVDHPVLVIGTEQRAFGDYTPGRFAWHFANVRRFFEPIPCSGARGLWVVPSAIQQKLEATPSHIVSGKEL